MSKVVGDKIKSIRLNCGETLEEFGKRFNTSKVTVFNWEKGRNLPNKSNLKEIAELGNMTVVELLGITIKVNDVNRILGNKIRNIRLGGNKHNKVYNQKEFADEIGATLQAVSNWENNRNKPNHYRLKALAELGGITVDELLGNSVKSAGANKALGERIKSIRFSRNETLEEFSNEINRVSNGVVKCGKSNVSRWERGENEPNYYTLLAISKIGNTTVDELLGNNCQLCNDKSFRADCYESNRELSASYFITDDRKIVTVIYVGEEYLGFSEIDISYCPECGRKLEGM